MDTGDVYGTLSALLGLSTENGDRYVKYVGEEVEYALSDLSVTVSNNGLASGQETGYLAAATFYLEVPVRFADRRLPSYPIVEVYGHRGGLGTDSLEIIG